MGDINVDIYMRNKKEYKTREPTVKKKIHIIYKYTNRSTTQNEKKNGHFYFSFSRYVQTTIHIYIYHNQAAIPPKTKKSVTLY